MLRRYRLVQSAPLRRLPQHHYRGGCIANPFWNAILIITKEFVRSAFVKHWQRCAETTDLHHVIDVGPVRFYAELSII